MACRADEEDKNKGTTSTDDGKKSDDSSSNKGDTTPKDGGGDGSQSKSGSQITLSEADLQKKFDELAGKVRSEEKQKYERSQKEAEEKANREKLEAEQKWKELYEMQRTENEKLKSTATDVQKLSAEVNSMIDKEIAEWPAELKALDPGTSNLDARKTWLEKARDLAKKMMSTKSFESEHGAGNKDQKTDSAKDQSAKLVGGIRKKYVVPGQVAETKQS